YVQLWIIERCESGNERGFKTHRARQQITGQNAPGALLAAYVAYSRHFIDDNAQLALSPNHILHNASRHAKRRRHAETAALAIGRIRPPAQERMPFALD